MLLHTRYAIAAALVFVLNLAWEVAQGPFYAGHDDFWQTLPMCAGATIGDVAIVAALFGFFALLRRRIEWYCDLGAAGWTALIATGGAVATSVEWWALATQRWEYAGMPMIPLLDVGVLPVLQMMIIPPTVALWLTTRC